MVFFTWSIPIVCPSKILVAMIMYFFRSLIFKCTSGHLGAAHFWVHAAYGSFAFWALKTMLETLHPSPCLILMVLQGKYLFPSWREIKLSKVTLRERQVLCLSATIPCTTPGSVNQHEHLCFEAPCKSVLKEQDKDSCQYCYWLRLWRDLLSAALLIVGGAN